MFDIFTFRYINMFVCQNKFRMRPKIILKLGIKEKGNMKIMHNNNQFSASLVKEEITNLMMKV